MIAELHVCGHAQVKNNEVWQAKNTQQTAWISIQDCFAFHLPEFQISQGVKPDLCLGLQFDDMTLPGEGAFSPDHARSVLAFVERLQSSTKNTLLIINCIMGWSRSVAVGMFLSTRLGVPLIFFSDKERADPNPLVLELLTKESKNEISDRTV